MLINACATYCKEVDAFMLGQLGLDTTRQIKGYKDYYFLIYTQIYMYLNYYEIHFFISINI